MYVHCGNCNWEQDDFWSAKYNPWTKLKRDFSCYWKPKRVCTEYEVFSWYWLAKCFFWRVKSLFTQKWWTYQEYKKEVNKICPKCKSKGLVTD